MRVLLATLLICLLVPGVASAQQGAKVDQCSRECDPKTVNGPEYKVGNDTVKQFLYGHFADILNMAPLNTQPPDPEHEPDLNRGFLMPVIDTNSGVCAPGGTTCADFKFRHNQFVMFSSPGLVEYLQEGWLTHQEPVLGYDIQVVGEEITLYWYMSPSGTGQDFMGAGAGAPGVMPLVGVYAKLETGRYTDRGETIAESDFSTTDPTSRTTMVSAPGEDAVYEFAVPLIVKKDSIPHDQNGFIVSVRPYQVVSPGDDGSQVMQPNWRLRSGAQYPIRVVLETREPMKTYMTDAKMEGDRLAILWEYSGALGNYDQRFDLRRLTLRGADATLNSSAVLELTNPIQYHGHDVARPFRAVWIIDPARLDLPDGPYQLEASVPNLQDTYLLNTTWDFRVVNGQIVLPDMAVFEGQATPLGPFGVLLGALALVAYLRRR